MLNLAGMSSTVSLCALLSSDLERSNSHLHTCCRLAAFREVCDQSQASWQTKGDGDHPAQIAFHICSEAYGHAGQGTCCTITLYNEQSCKLLQALQTCLCVFLFFVHRDMCYVGSCTFTLAFMSEMLSLYV